MLLVRPDFPAKTAQEFIAYVKANPGKVNYASQGIGTTSHLTAALFERVTGTRLLHVPYKGTAPALNDLIAGHVDLIFMELASAIKLHEAGRARILAVATEKRIANLPDIPTLDEAQPEELRRSGTWNAIAAPPKTPAAIVTKLNAAIDAVLKSPDVQAKFAKINLHAAGGTPAEAFVVIVCLKRHHVLAFGGGQLRPASRSEDRILAVHDVIHRQHHYLAVGEEADPSDSDRGYTLQAPVERQYLESRVVGRVLCHLALR